MLRDRIGEREDRFFATVFLGSGMLFVGMLFVAAAIGGGIIVTASTPGSSLPGAPGSDTLTLGRSITTILVNIYAVRMAAVFTLTTVTMARRTGIVSRWLNAWRPGRLLRPAAQVPSSLPLAAVNSVIGQGELVQPIEHRRRW